MDGMNSIQNTLLVRPDFADYRPVSHITARLWDSSKSVPAKHRSRINLITSPFRFMLVIFKLRPHVGANRGIKLRFAVYLYRVLCVVCEVWYEDPLISGENTGSIFRLSDITTQNTTAWIFTTPKISRGISCSVYQTCHSCRDKHFKLVWDTNCERPLTKCGISKRSALHSGSMAREVQGWTEQRQRATSILWNVLMTSMSQYLIARHSITTYGRDG
jgi:hypothetical protein